MVGKEAARAHRRSEAEQGFPLLRGCPSTLVLRLIVALDDLSLADRLDYADQVSELAEAQAGAGLPAAEREALLDRLPLLAKLERWVPDRPDMRFQSVTTLARLAADPGGIEGFVRMQGLTAAAADPPRPHVPSFAEAVPVLRSKLRKAVAEALETEFGAKVRTDSPELDQLVVAVPRGQMVLNVMFGGGGRGGKSQQLGYSLWADLDGVRMVPTSYEALWLKPSQWDLITPANTAAGVAHLVRLVKARLALG